MVRPFRSLVIPFCLALAGLTNSQEIPFGSERPTFEDKSPIFTSIPGKIVLEEHVSTSLFQAAFTTPFHEKTNEIPYGNPAYQADVRNLLNVTSMKGRVHQMDLANISLSIVSLVPPGIQGFFNKTLAVEMAAAVNDQMYKDYKTGIYSDRFEFFCSVALQNPSAAAIELNRCVTELGGVGVMINSYTNNGSVNDITYLDDPIYAPFWQELVSLDVPLYLHPRMPPPNQQRAYQGYDFLSGSPYGFSADAGIHVLRMMVSGLFDTYPTLQIVLGHCGEGLPFILARVDQRMRHLTRSQWSAKQTMSYYWQNNFHVTSAGVMDEPALTDTIRVSGEDRVMFSVDYPFEDDVEMSAWFDRLQISSSVKRAIAYGNAQRLFKLG
ncbi:2,3-dihydroxybenzoate decarboxylase [Phlyctema vagabunda]|uniref:2,3-dihydroxybenzoate decarboxylase n=1 Tax=Phlyctema vagabunda TaxID=108571 RepID=A0ABR4P1I9_9HELO